MPTFSAITVGKIASTKQKSPKEKKRPSMDETRDRPSFASPILYTTPKTTPLPYIARSFTSSPYVINHKRRVPPSTLVVERIEAIDAVSHNGFLLGERNQECGDTQQGEIEKLGDVCEDLVKNDTTLARNGGSLLEIAGNLHNRAIEEVGLREESVVAEKMSSGGEILVKNGERLIEDGERLVSDEENTALEEVRVRDECKVAGKLVIHGENWTNIGGYLFKDVNLVKNYENRGIEEVRVSEQFGAVGELGTSAENSVNNGEKLVCGDEHRAIDIVRVTKEGVAEKNGIREKIANQELSVEIGRFEVGGTNSVLKKSAERGEYTPRTNRTDFFDAEDDLFSEDEVGQSTRTFNSRIHVDLDCLRSKVSKESERITRAEEALSVCQNIWQELMDKFSAVGLSLPSIEIGACQGVEVTTVDVITDVFGQLTIATTVANAVGRASIRAEIEREFEVLIDNKNSEISRLHDKLKYYEFVNHEMSQRNQEAMELARRCRQTHKKKQRWIWGSFAVSFAVGTAALAYTYIPWAQMNDRVPLVCSRFNIHRTASTSI